MFVIVMAPSSPISCEMRSYQYDQVKIVSVVMSKILKIFSHIKMDVFVSQSVIVLKPKSTASTDLN